MAVSSKPTYYQGINGGALPIDAPTYVERDADRQLYEFLRDSENNNRPCYILAARQMGKSSLMVKVAHQLNNDARFIGVQVNLHRFGDGIHHNNFYLSLLQVICDEIKLPGKNLVQELELYAFWQQKSQLPAALRFRNFTQKILQEIGDRRLIVFIDEIQSLINWNIQNSFIGLIKALSSEASLINLSFVLLGVVKPSDLLTDANFAFNAAQPIELKNFEGDCQPLLEGLKEISNNPNKVLQEILAWTGGQPFLTQVVCDLVARKGRLKDEYNVKSQIDKLVEGAILVRWREKDRQSHFQTIEDWFKRGYPKKKEKVVALNLYRRIRHRYRVIFDSGKEEHLNLIISGLVVKLGQYLVIANQIYREVFTEEWIEQTKYFIQNQEVYMPSIKIYNRDVFILVDRSDSMNDKDDETGDLTRWEFVKQELLKGDIRKILTQSSGEQKICDQINLYLFSRKQVGLDFAITSADELDDIFRENTPDTTTYICPTFEKCIKTWNQNGRKEGRAAFVIIYTDGMLSDRTQFEKLIGETCKTLNNQDEIEIVMIGIGKKVYDNPIPFLDLDFNLKQNKDAQGNPCDIFAFDVVNEIEDIIEFLSRQIEGESSTSVSKVPDWVQERHPDWFQKYLRLIESQ